MNYETSGVMWHVDPESKIQLVNCKLSTKFPLGYSSLLYIRAIDTCTSAISMCLSVSSDEPGMNYETSGVMWHVDPESKIQFCQL